MKSVRTLTDEQHSRVKDVGYDYESKDKRRVTRCDCCGGTIFTAVANHDRYYHRVNGLLCHGCGLLFLNPQLSEQATFELYREYYRPLVSAYHGRVINEVTLEIDQEEYTKELISHFVNVLPMASIRSICDVGGSTGVLLRDMGEFIFRSSGVKVDLVNIDPAAKEASRSVEKGIETIEGMAESLDLGGRKFDIVLLCQTVDHLRSISATLKRIWDILNEEGYFYIDIVDYKKIASRVGSIEGALKIDHNYNLSAHTMRRYLYQAGFSIDYQFVHADKHHIGFVCRKSSIFENSSSSDYESAFELCRRFTEEIIDAIK